MYRRSFEETDNIFLTVVSKDNYQSIGTMTAYIALPHGTADIGIMIGDRSVWGCGYGFDAWCTLLQWLLRSGVIRKVTAGTLDCNKPMIKLMQRSGMHLEATRKGQEIIDGYAIDIQYYARFANS